MLRPRALLACWTQCSGGVLQLTSMQLWVTLYADVAWVLRDNDDDDDDDAASTTAAGPGPDREESSPSEEFGVGSANRQNTAQASRDSSHWQPEPHKSLTEPSVGQPHCVPEGVVARGWCMMRIP
ncbi:hypothetical protein CSOJ01_00639 [Colletotrichum sojae]|uniref:Uncharacterized protein n=1 Tax=Colletotrichum sojae TaxID=2175907 RepID=A0A8H6JX77_9PEZI|nr:hypothetical protein CSOJ01_00639 [Colletotrichum sojae]